jgi:hypothetical protein
MADLLLYSYALKLACLDGTTEGLKQDKHSDSLQDDLKDDQHEVEDEKAHVQSDSPDSQRRDETSQKPQRGLRHTVDDVDDPSDDATRPPMRGEHIDPREKHPHDEYKNIGINKRLDDPYENDKRKHQKGVD